MNIASFVLGLVSWVGGSCFIIPPILGIIFGIIGLNKKEDNRGLGIAGIVLSAVGLVVVLVWVLIFGGAAVLSGLASY